MIDIAMILGGAAIGGAIGLLGRCHDNKVKKEYERGYRLGYKEAEDILLPIVERKKNEAGIKETEYTELLFGNYLYDALVMQYSATKCSVGVTFARNDYLKLVVRFGDFFEKYEEFIMTKNTPRNICEEKFDKFRKRYIELENAKIR